MAHQLRGGGGVVPDLNLPAPEAGEQEPPPAAEVNRISSLPEKVLLRILSFLPLKTIVLLGMVSRRWLRFVSKLPYPCDFILWIHIRPATQEQCDCGAKHVPSDQIVPLLAKDVLCPDHRLIHFFLKVDDPQTRPADVDALLDYAADCDVQHVGVIDYRRRRYPPEPELSFNFQRASHHLSRLELFGVGAFNEVHRPMSQLRSINTLEIITIEYTSLGDNDLSRILLSCCRLRILVLRGCCVLTCVNVTEASKHLVRLTVAECPQVDQISVSAAVGLHSFRYKGACLPSLALPQTCLGDLCIGFTAPRVSSPNQYYSWLSALPNLSNLVVLTICSNVLLIISSLRGTEDFQPQVANLMNLQKLRELQLVLYDMSNVELSSVYGFLRMCRCPRLRNLFVELPEVVDESFMDAVTVCGLFAEEPPMNDFNDLVLVKITNFKWQCYEIELVFFLHRKVSSLQKVILVVPKGTILEKDKSGNPISPDIHLRCFENFPANKVVVSDYLGAKTRTFHRDVFSDYV